MTKLVTVGGVTSPPRVIVTFLDTEVLIFPAASCAQA